MAHTNIIGRGLAATATVAVLALSACGEDSKSSSATPPAAEQQDSPDGDQSLSGGGGRATADTTAGGSTATTPQVPAQPYNPGGRQLVITMTVGVEVSDAAAAVDKVIALAAQYGGQLYNSSLDLTDPQTAAGDLVFKLPPDQVQAFLTGLDPGIGRRTGLQGNTADVTKQLTDLGAQILTAEASVDRVRALLEAAANLTDVITLENELSTRETHLEQLRAQQADLGSQVAQATITVRLTTAPEEAAAPTPEPKQDKGIGDAFRDGWKGFVAVLAGVAIFIGYTAPFLVFGGLAALIWWRISRRRRSAPSRNRSAAPPPPPAPGAGPHTSTPDSADAARIP